MPLGVDLVVAEQAVQTSASRNLPMFAPGVSVSYERGVLVVIEGDVWWTRETSSAGKQSAIQPRLSVLGGVSLGEDVSFVAGVGPMVAVRWSTLQEVKATTVLLGARATAGLDGRPFPKAGWSVGARVGGAAHRFGFDGELGLRTGWRW